MSSRNSSKPPSSDSAFVKPTPKSLRGKSGRRPGGQPGHPGSTLVLVADPNERRRHEPGPCTGCGADLATAPEVGMERRQVFDLPPMTVQVTEHQLITRRCRCGASTCGAAPEGVSAPVQYGQRITAIILYLYVGQFLSTKRTAQALAELFDTPVAEGTVASMTARGAAGLDEFLTEVGDRIAASEVAGFDETGLRVAGRLAWVHCARTSTCTLITCHSTRGRAGINDAGVLTRFSRGRGARRLGPLRHLRRCRTPTLLCPRPARAGRRRRHRAAGCRLVLGHPSRRRARRDAETRCRRDRRRRRHHRPRHPGQPGAAGDGGSPRRRRAGSPVRSPRRWLLVRGWLY